MGAPLIFSGPGIPKNQETYAFSYLLDVFPTLCALLGVRAPGDLDGRDLSPIWKGEKTKVRDAVFTSFRDLMKAVRDERWKLIRYPQDRSYAVVRSRRRPAREEQSCRRPGRRSRGSRIDGLDAGGFSSRPATTIR